MTPNAGRAERTDYALLDAGEHRRLERFGARVVDRPAPTADGWRHADDATWNAADLRFDPGRGWSGAPAAAEPWPVTIDGLTLELRPTTSGGLGIYPEHAQNLPWLEDQIAKRVADGRQATVLNLFAHTGLVTLAAARAGAAVTHVDAARTAVAWARRNAELSNLADRPIRWIVDDALTFVAREARRGRRYDGIVLDPPSFGRSRKREWRLADELAALLASCRDVAAEDAFVLLTAHTTGMDGERLVDVLRAAMPHPRATIESGPLIGSALSLARIDLGWSVRSALAG